MLSALMSSATEDEALTNAMKASTNKAAEK
jgi:hypothetical protein